MLAGAVFLLGGGFRTKVETCSYYVTFECKRSFSFLLWGLTRKKWVVISEVLDSGSPSIRKSTNLGGRVQDISTSTAKKVRNIMPQKTTAGKTLLAAFVFNGGIRTKIGAATNYETFELE